MEKANGRLLSLAALLLCAVQIALPWTVGGRSPTGQAILVLFLTLAGVIGFVLEGSSPRSGPSPLLLLIGSLTLISAVHTIYLDRTVQSLLLLLSYILAAALAAHAARNVRWAASILLVGISISGVLVSLGGMFQLLHGGDGGLYARVLTGPFGYPNAAGGFLLLTAGAALAVARMERESATRTAAIAAALVSILGIALTHSHGVMLAAAVGFVTWALTDRPAWWPQRHVWAGAGALGLLLVISFVPHWLSSLPLRVWSLFSGATADTSFMWRLHILQWTWSMVRDNPWWGLGPGAFPVALTHYQRIPYVSGQNPHNLYLEVSAEYGLPVAILAVAALGIFLGRTGAAIRRTPAKDPARRRLAVLLAILVAFAVHSLLDLDWSFPAIATTVAIMLGLTSTHLSRKVPREGRGHSLWRGTLLLLLLGMALLGASRYYSSTLVNWSQLSLASRDVALAEQDLTWALRLNPMSFLARQSMAWALLRSGDPGGAVEVAEGAVRLAPLDPNSQFLAGEIAASVKRWDLAGKRFLAAVDRSPSAQLRFHAGLIESAAQGGKATEARFRYERAIEIFTPDRVLSGDARCLAPGDRYLLARLSRLVARLHAEAGDLNRYELLMTRAALLAQPDQRGICITLGRPGQTSPEAAMESFWRAFGEGGWSQASQFLAPGNPPPRSQDSVGGWVTGDGLRQARVAWIAALSGGEGEASLRFQVELEGSRGERAARCAHGELRLIGSDWYLGRFPSVEAGPCQP